MSGKDFSPDDIARILCAVPTAVMEAGLIKRQEHCPTDLELFKMYLSIALFIVDLLPLPAVVATLVKELLLGLIAVIVALT